MRSEPTELLPQNKNTDYVGYFTPATPATPAVTLPLLHAPAVTPATGVTPAVPAGPATRATAATPSWFLATPVAPTNGSRLETHTSSQHRPTPPQLLPRLRDILAPGILASWHFG
ncbi:hypothetical protein E4U42_004666 [Claviceps africana]|uniref:Uncharacterized protein n=1 Tax=Claviceps africana TaxID=83212 RepID=A0A8K0J5I0_9HYPO|nr:hypothetical protein E4U42_004666 [Claviceps africana]